jgi:hypothetical protein
MNRRSESGDDGFMATIEECCFAAVSDAEDVIGFSPESKGRYGDTSCVQGTIG